MLSRRAFLERGSLAVAAMSLGATHAAHAQSGALSGPLGKPIGLQLYTVREAVAKDLQGTLRTLAGIGYREVELAGMPTGAKELRAMLSDLGMTAPSMHASMAELQEGLQERIDYAQTLGTQYLVCSFPWTSDGRFRSNPGHAVVSLASGITLDDWKWNAEQLNKIGAAANQAGLRCGYHNHNMEFRAYDGVVAYDELLRMTDPKLVTMEMDIAWVVTAGADPVKYLRKHEDRIALLHVKDVRKDLMVTADRLQAQTTEVGSGKIDWKRTFKAMEARQIQHYFVEQENFERTPLEAVKISFDYLRTLAGIR
ncbi:MAG TPA: sugar phosphate isomerase/epimerase [Steroidobacteraceae bacterium]|nr:sugar phosphate isomerase/epimerase [Steroidobacteraceae bacterium]